MRKRIDYKAINTYNGEVTKRVVIKYKVGRKRRLVLSTNINADQQLTAVSAAFSLVWINGIISP